MIMGRGKKKSERQDSPRFQAGGSFQLEFAKHSDNWPLGQVCREKNVGPWTPLFLNTKAALPHLEECVSLLYSTLAGTRAGQLQN